MAERALGSPVTAATEPTHRTRRLRVGLSAALLVVVVLAILGGLFHRRIGHQLALSFVRQPDPFSEIYFSDPQSLLQTVPAGSTQTVTFAVNNQTGSSRTYPWVAEASTSGGTAAQIAHGTVTVADRAAGTVTFRFAVTARRNRPVEVTVLLPDQGQHIDFHTRTT